MTKANTTAKSVAVGHIGLCLIIMATGLAIGGCQPTPLRNGTPAAVVEEPAPASTSDFSATEAAPATNPIAAPEPTWQYNIDQLLAEADAALAGDRLTTPIEDNAFDRYNAVLILQPDNQEAINGLQEIFDRYVLLAKDAMRSVEYGKARALIERARAVNSQAPTIDALLQELAQKQKELARSQPQIAVDPEQKEIELSLENLNRRDGTIVGQLQQLAELVRDSDETLLIVARNDAEGRWIYQQMAESVPGYRIRGDIRLGLTPKVLLLPPIE